MVWPKENLLPNSPAQIQRLPIRPHHLLRRGIRLLLIVVDGFGNTLGRLNGLGAKEAESAEEDDVDVLTVKFLSKECLPSTQIHYRAVMQNYFDCIQSEFAENWVVIVEAEMRYIHLSVILIGSRGAVLAICRHATPLN